MQLEFINVFRNYNEVHRVWTQASKSHYSYFLSWSWIENWLALLPSNIKLYLAVVSLHDQLQFAFFCGFTKVLRHKVFGSRAYFLNETGVPSCDDIYVEHNAILSSADAPSLRALLELLPKGWDEFFLSGLDSDSFPGNSLQEDLNPYKVQILASRPCPYVDLSLVRKKDDYIGLLSANTRSQIRRAYKQYEQRGPVRLEAANSIIEGRDVFEELVQLHQASWRARGESGSFASGRFYDFHKRLIEQRFSSGEIQLVRIRAGDSTIGCLYSFLYRGKINFYQGGLVYESDNRLKPGLVCHAEAIQFNAKCGHSVYDFLGGDSRYKRSLATHESTLIWAKVQRPRIKFWLEEQLTAAKTRWRKPALRIESQEGVEA